MIDLSLKPQRGGFLRPFHLGSFIRDFLMGKAPYGSPAIDPVLGAPQADIFSAYKRSLIGETALDKATRAEEKLARSEGRRIDPENIEKLVNMFKSRMPYKGHGCRYHSFVTTFSTIKKLGWVETSGYEEPSSFQHNYAAGQPRRFYRLTQAGLDAPDPAWSNPQVALYGYR